MKRIAFGRIAQETNALSPLLSTLADFKRTHWFEGDELLARCASSGTEAPGMVRNAELSGFVRAVKEHGGGAIELVPLFSAWAVPSGKLARSALEELRERLIEGLRAAGPLDGLFLSMHGSMVAEGEGDPEALLLEAAREALGPDVPIGVSYDLHGHLTARKVAAAPILGAYRTNPHRDHAQTGYRVGRMLVGSVLASARPTTAWRTLPMVLGGGTTIDFFPTMRPVFRRMKRMERDPRVLCVSLFMVHLWNDNRDLGWSTCVVTDGDPELAERLSEELADLAWSVRHAQPPQLPSAQEAIARARRARLARRFGTVCISDASDMVGAGAPGANTKLIRALLEEAADLTSLASLRDPVAVEALWSVAEGETASIELGGRLAPSVYPALPVTGTVVSKAEETLFGRAVVLDCGPVKLVLTETPPLAMKPSFYRDLGLEPVRADITVVRSLFPFRYYFLRENRKTLYARTGGFTDLDALLRLEFDGPVHPKDPVEEWRTTDRRRRGVATVGSTIM